MSKTGRGVAIALSFVPACVQAQPPSPPPPGVLAPVVRAVPAAAVEAAIRTPQHCLLTRGQQIVLTASESGRQALLGLDPQPQTLSYLGANPVRNGGHLHPLSGTFDFWIVVEPAEDERLDRGLARHVTVIINGADGGASTFQGAYTCNY